MKRLNKIILAGALLFNFSTPARLALGVITALSSATFSNVSANAQQQGGKWQKVCRQNRCYTAYRHLGTAGILQIAVSLIQSKDETTAPLFQVGVQVGVSIPEGVQVQIHEGKVNTLSYSICHSSMCVTEQPFSDRQFQAFRDGGSLKLTYTDLYARKRTFSVPLDGFAAAVDGEPSR